jgi:hypothetical protein
MQRFRVGSSDAFAQTDAQQRAQYETAAVRTIFGAYGLPMPNKKNGQGSANILLLEHIHDWIPQFPLHITACRAKYVFEITAADLLNDASKLVLLDEWYKASLECTDHTRPFGILFAWPAVRRGGRFMLLHDYPRVDGDYTAAHDQVRVAIGIRQRGGVMKRLTIERLADFLLDVAKVGDSGYDSDFDPSEYE